VRVSGLQLNLNRHDKAWRDQRFPQNGSKNPY